MSGHAPHPGEAAPPAAHTLQAAARQLQARMQQQLSVLDNLKYEGEILTDKLMKLRASRQDLEAELFGLKHKRIRLLEVIRHLEDEEMQLVSEVQAIVRHKRRVLAELPCFEARARASAGLAVVQDYLLASVHHLGQHGGAGSTPAAAAAAAPAPGAAAVDGAAAAAAAGAAATASAPTWSGTAQVPRPSATWDMSLMPVPPVTATASTQTERDLAAGVEHAATSQRASGEQQTQQQQQPPPPPPPHQLQLQRQKSQVQAASQQALRGPASGPFGDITPAQLMQLQRRESIPADALPTLPEGKPLSGGVGPACSLRSDLQQRGGSGPMTDSARSSGEFQRSRSRDLSSLYTWSSLSSNAPPRQGSSGLSRGTSASLGSSPSGGSFTSAQRPLPLSSRPSLDEPADSGGTTLRQHLMQQQLGRGVSGASPPPPPPPHRSRSGTLGSAGDQEQMQRLSQQQQQQHHHQRQQQRRQHQEAQELQRQQLFLAQQHLQLQQREQQQALLQQIEQQRLLDTGTNPAEAAAAAAVAAAAAMAYDTSSASLDVVSIASSSLPGYSTGSLPPSAGLPHMAGSGAGLHAGRSSESLWTLPAGTLVLTGDVVGGGADVSQQLQGLVQLSGMDSNRASLEQAGVEGPLRRLTLDEAFQLAVTGTGAGTGAGAGLGASNADAGSTPGRAGLGGSGGSSQVVGGLLVSPSSGAASSPAHGAAAGAAGGGATPPLVVLSPPDEAGTAGQVPGSLFHHHQHGHQG